MNSKQHHCKADSSTTVPLLKLSCRRSFLNLMSAEGLRSLFILTVQRFYGEELPLLQSGFVSVTELVDAMSDTLVLKPAEQDRGQHWLVSVIQDSDALQTGVWGGNYSAELHHINDRVLGFFNVQREFYLLNTLVICVALKYKEF